MKIDGSGTVYKNQYGYSISDNQKQQDGTVNKFYIPVRFKRGLVEPNDRQFISISGYTRPYKTKEDKLGMSYFVMDWTPIGNEPDSSKPIEQPKQSNTFYTEEIEITDADLPF